MAKSPISLLPYISLKPPGSVSESSEHVRKWPISPSMLTVLCFARILLENSVKTFNFCGSVMFPLQTCDTVYLSCCRSVEVQQSSVSVWAVWLKHSQINWQVLEKDPAVWALLFNEVLAAQNQKCLFFFKPKV